MTKDATMFAASTSLQEVPSAQVENVAKPTTATVFSPSLGMPEEKLAYRVSPILPSSPTAEEIPAESPVSLRVTIPGASVPFVFAHRQWRAGLILADLIACASSNGACGENAPLNVHGQDVLELGCGTGVPGMVSSKLAGARKTILTDYDSPELVQTLKNNLQANFSSQEIKSAIRSLGFTWGTSIEDVEDTLDSMRGAGSNPHTDRHFSRILLADCMWDSLSHQVLIKSLSQLLRRDEHARVLVVSGLHTGREKITSFIRRAARVGLVLKDVDEGVGLFPPIQQQDEVEGNETPRVSESDACYAAQDYVYEVELSDGGADAAESEAESHVIDTGCSPRLTGRRRRFVLDERPEERKEVGGVHIRNRWITVWALGWAKS